MDETEKYKQRLEVIAEKRRLQEEQDKARRDMEDEKLRLQQLKRKSLRDQWLMEGPPLSPTASDGPKSPRSPLWGSPGREMEKPIDKIQSESQWLAKEEKLNEQMEDGQAEAMEVAEEGAEKVQDTVVQNGENNSSELETPQDEAKINQSRLLDKTAAALTNGGGHLEVETSHNASEQIILSTTNGTDVKMELQEVKEEAEEEEGTLVMRAKRIIITDEGDDIPEDLEQGEYQQESMQTEESPLLNPEVVQERGEAVEDLLEPQTAQEAQQEEDEPAETTAEEQPADDEVQAGLETIENKDGEPTDEGQDSSSEDPSSMSVQSPAHALEGTTVASVPVYSEEQPSALTPGLEAEGQTAAPQEGNEGAEGAEGAEGVDAEIKDQGLSTLSAQFQEVPLADPLDNQRTGGEPGEQEPLLSQAKAPDTQAEPPAAAAAAATETQSPSNAGQREGAAAPKHKSCQCCSVM